MPTAFRSIAIATLTMCSATGAASVQVKTTAGAVRGAVSADGTARIFTGIPYAAPPTGALRWKEPQPPTPWEGVRDATQLGRQCMQGPIFGDITFAQPASEDCLNLNVW